MKSGDIEAISRENEPTAFVPREEYEKLREEIEVLKIINNNLHDLMASAEQRGREKGIQEVIENARKLITSHVR